MAAVAKPPGLLVHRTGLDAGETRFALQMLRAQLGRPVWPVHRLDKGTSGVLLFALDAAAASALGRQFEAGTVRKTYLALVRGWPASSGCIDHPLRRMKDDARPRARRPAAATDAAAADTAAADAALPALTRYTTLARYTLPVPHGAFAATRCAQLALMPETGRRHQLRRHCKHMAHPIIGDATHGKGPLNRALAPLLGTSRLWLHAWQLALAHPATGAPLCLQAAPGPEWQALMPWRMD